MPLLAQLVKRSKFMSEHEMLIYMRKSWRYVQCNLEFRVRALRSCDAIVYWWQWNIPFAPAISQCKGITSVILFTV